MSSARNVLEDCLGEFGYVTPDGAAEVDGGHAERLAEDFGCFSAIRGGVEQIREKSQAKDGPLDTLI
ncbi:hypothetical protein QQ045_005512 [Rhodiola kirilowii]